MIALFTHSLTQVHEHENHIRQNARITDELDVTIAFANLAQEMHFTRPTVREE
jgi:DNA mismatch repair ATPase MutS